MSLEASDDEASWEQNYIMEDLFGQDNISFITDPQINLLNGSLWPQCSDGRGREESS